MVFLAVAAACFFFASGCANRRVTQQERARSADQLANEAREAKDRGDSRSAEYLLTAAVDANPQNCETRLELSELLAEHGSLARASSHLERVVAERPDDPRGHVRLAQVAWQQRDFARAGELAERALSLDPHNPQALVLRGRLALQYNDPKSALDAFYQALGAAPDDVEARLLIAECHLRQSDVQQASPLLREIVEGESACEQVRSAAAWKLGQCYAREGRWADAAASLQAGIHGQPPSAANWTQLAWALYHSGDSSAARRAVDTSLNLSRYDTEAHSLLKLLASEPAGPPLTGVASKSSARRDGPGGQP